jgi:hypothetical protein
VHDLFVRQVRAELEGVLAAADADRILDPEIIAPGVRARDRGLAREVAGHGEAGEGRDRPEERELRAEVGEGRGGVVHAAAELPHVRDPELVDLGGAQSPGVRQIDVVLGPLEVTVDPRDVAGEREGLGVRALLIEVAQGHGLARGQLVVELEGALVRVEGVGPPHFIEVVRQIREGDELVLDVLRGHVESRTRDDAAGEGLPGCRVSRLDRRLREVAGPFECRRNHRRVPVVGLFLTEAGVAHEEERLILAQGPAEGGAELIAAQGILGGRHTRGGPSLRIELLIAEELEGGSVELVGARLGHDVHDTRGIAAVLGGIAVREHAELLHRFRVRRGVARAAQARGVVAAVELEVDAAHLGAARTIDGGQLFGTAERVGVVVARHAARETQERVQVAIDEGEVQDLVLADGAGERGGRGLHERRVGHDRNRFRQGAEVDDGVDARVAADLKDDSTARIGLEAGHAHHQHVVAHGQQTQGVLAGGVRGGRARVLRARVGGGDRGSGDGGAR